MTTLLAVGNGARQQKFTRTLKAHGCTAIHTTGDASEAVHMLQRNRYDLVVFDDTVRGMEPLEFALTLHDVCQHDPIVLAATPAAEPQFRRLGPTLSPHLVDLPERIDEALASVANGRFCPNPKQEEDTDGKSR